jgi:hypothetical protein
MHDFLADFLYFHRFDLLSWIKRRTADMSGQSNKYSRSDKATYYYTQQ